jgi:hypothetical protein
MDIGLEKEKHLGLIDENVFIWNDYVVTLQINHMSKYMKKKT